MYEVVPTREKEYKTLKHNKTMTILELQKKLQEMYERYGDVEVRHQYGDVGDYCGISCVTRDGGDIVIL